MRELDGDLSRTRIGTGSAARQQRIVGGFLIAPVFLTPNTEMWQKELEKAESSH